MTYRIICNCDQNCVNMVSIFVSNQNGIWMIQVADLRSGAVDDFLCKVLHFPYVFTIKYKANDARCRGFQASL